MSTRTFQPTALRLLAAAFAVSACDGDSSTGPAQPVASVQIAALQGELWAGAVRQLHATARAADGTPLAGRNISWSSSNDAIAEVDPSGRLTAHAAGTVTISAMSEGRIGLLVVEVSELDLLYEGYWTGLPEMLVLGLGGGEPTRLLPPYTLLFDPEPSPDGTKIAFVVADYESSTGDIFVINRDGTQLKQLTFDSELDDQPAWSPDGTKIAFRSFRAQRLGDIWVMNADGSNPTNLTPDPLPATTDENRPAWSPDGSHIAYGSNAGGNMDLWTMRADGTDKRRRTATPDYDTEPTWSPDGTKIAFRRSGAALGSDIMLIDVAGGEPVRLANEGNETAPAWSPDGRYVAFTFFPLDGGSPQIYTMRPDGTDRTLRTTDYRWNGGRNPAWLRRR